MPKREFAFVVTCEHASNAVPRGCEHLFRGAQRSLDSHRGWDPGARALARRVGGLLGTTAICGRHTRLLVDLNRSPGNPNVFGPAVRRLSRGERADLLARYHEPHWKLVRDAVPRNGRRPTIHLAIHSFVPALDGAPRRVDIGLLYDPGREEERALCRAWQRGLQRTWPDRRVRRNRPYRGTSDGLTTALRRELPASTYLGIEIEVNQALLAESTAGLSHGLVASLRDALVGL